MDQLTAYMLAWLTFNGYPLVQRDAVYYAAKSESNLRTDAISRQGNIGLFQLNGTRKYALVAYAREQNKPWTSVKIQLEFMDREWRNMTGSKEFFTAKDRATAARLFCKHYEGSIC
jgi:hypothetical protein